MKTTKNRRVVTEGEMDAQLDLFEQAHDEAWCALSEAKYRLDNAEKKMVEFGKYLAKFRKRLNK